MNEGWKCPVCGRGVAPSEKTCDHAGQAVAPNPFQPYQPQPVLVPLSPTLPQRPWWEPPFITTCGGAH